ADRTFLDGVELHARKPAGKDILAELAAQAVLDPLPALLIRAGPVVLLLRREGSRHENFGRASTHHGSTSGNIGIVSTDDVCAAANQRLAPTGRSLSSRRSR